MQLMCKTPWFAYCQLCLCYKLTVTGAATCAPYFYAGTKAHLWFITLAPRVQANYNSLNTVGFIFSPKDNNVAMAETEKPGREILMVQLFYFLRIFVESKAKRGSRWET